MAKAIHLVHQPFLPGICTAETEAATMAEGSIKERGAVFNPPGSGGFHSRPDRIHNRQASL